MSSNNTQINQDTNISNTYEIMEQNIPNYDFSYKIVIVGNPGN